MLQMADITVLKDYARTGKSIYTVFKATETEDASIMQEPFVQITLEEVTSLICKWMSERKGKVVMLQLRMHTTSCDIMHYVGIRAYEKHVYIMYVHDLLSNPQQITHQWESTTTYMNLMEDEIRKSVMKAQELNYLKIARRVQDERLAINAIIESLVPQASEEALENIDLEATDELLEQTITS